MLWCSGVVLFLTMLDGLSAKIYHSLPLSFLVSFDWVLLTNSIVRSILLMVVTA